MTTQTLYNSSTSSTGLIPYNHSITSQGAIPSPLPSMPNEQSVGLSVGEHAPKEPRERDLTATGTGFGNNTLDPNQTREGYSSRWEDEEKSDESPVIIPKVTVRKIVQPSLDKVTVKEFSPRTSHDPNFPVLRDLFVRSFDHFYREIEAKLKIRTGKTLAEWLRETYDEMQEEMLQRKCRCFMLCAAEAIDKDNPNGVLGFMTVREEGKGSVYIAQCAIAPIIKRKGYGTRLLQHLREIYPSGTYYWGLCRRANEPAVQFYLRQGASCMDKDKVEEAAKKYGYDPELYDGFEFVDKDPTNVSNSTSASSPRTAAAAAATPAPTPVVAVANVTSEERTKPEEQTLIEGRKSKTPKKKWCCGLI